MPNLEDIVGQRLSERGLTLAVAESCTGGLLGHRLTNVSGSSRYFLGGVVSYANPAKESLLSVPKETMVKHGAVSPETAVAMAAGVRRLLAADLALSVTGISGPTGGTPEKPVGLTYIALATPEGARVERYLFAGDRLANKTLAAEAALRLLIEHLEAASQKG
ncbi:MAG: nicotinamide-nucleotide amidohydrolase family protein [Chloroflexi bacterium]|nr:nicotinamide-nucleotide amidohydrolase family protein [Chloroflexota bacterium]